MRVGVMSQQKKLQKWIGKRCCPPSPECVGLHTKAHRLPCASVLVDVEIGGRLSAQPLLVPDFVSPSYLMLYAFLFAALLLMTGIIYRATSARRKVALMFAYMFRDPYTPFSCTHTIFSLCWRKPPLPPRLVWHERPHPQPRRLNVRKLVPARSPGYVGKSAADEEVQAHCCSKAL